MNSGDYGLVELRGRPREPEPDRYALKARIDCHQNALQPGMLSVRAISVLTPNLSAAGPDEERHGPLQ